MKFKIVYQTQGLYFEAEALNEQERKDIVKGLTYTTRDLLDAHLIGYAPVEPVMDVYPEAEEEVKQPVVEYATDGQKKYMAKLGIPFNNETTKIEAMDLIKDYKIAHGIPIK